MHPQGYISGGPLLQNNKQKQDLLLRKGHQVPAARLPHDSDQVRVGLYCEVTQIRARWTLEKKIKHAIGRREFAKAAHLKKQIKPLELDHIIKERHPTFDSALNELDDALSTIYLFANATPKGDLLPPERVQNCMRLCREFEAYVIRAHCLKKVFVSVKGIYYQAVISGVTVTWLAPHHERHEVGTTAE